MSTSHAMWWSCTILAVAAFFGLGLPSQAQEDAVARGPFLSVEVALSALPDREVETIHRFVAEDIGYHPYPGILRGSKGTLWARAGNSYDQSHLLAALLRTAGFETRYAACNLAADTISGLLASIRPRSVLLSEVPAFEEISDDPAALYGEFADRVETSYALIERALSSAGISFSEDPPTEADAPRQWAARHVWVQVNQDGDWRDLDPAAALSPGETLCAASATFAAIPDDDWHKVNVSLVSETLADSATRLDTHLSFSATVADAVGVPFLLAYETPKIDAVTLLAQGEPATFTPVLVAGNDVIRGEVLNFVPGAKESGDTGGGGLFGGLGELAGAISGETPDELVAAWFQVEFVSPIGSETISKPIFDRLGYAARASGTPDYSNLVEEPTDWAWDTLSFGIMTGGAPADLGWNRIEGMLNPDPLLAAASANAVAFDLFQILRESVPPLSFDFAGVISYVDAPNLMFLEQSVAEDGSFIASTLDHMRKTRAVVPLSDDTLVPYERIFDGVIDHEIERLTASILAQDDELAQPVSISVGDVIDKAVADGIGLILQPSGEQMSASMSAEAEARVGTLTKKYALLLPAVPVKLGDTPLTGYWAVDQLTGRTFDQMENGRHQAGSQYVQGNEEAGKKAPLTQRMFRAVCKVAGNAAVGLVISVGIGVVVDPPQGINSAASQLRESCDRRKGGKAAAGRGTPAGSGPPGGKPPGLGPYSTKPPGKVPFPPSRSVRPPRSELASGPKSPLSPRGRPVPKKPYYASNPTRPAPLRPPR